MPGDTQTGTSIGDVRLAVSIPSAASLGAYEAGASAALITALHRLNSGHAETGAPRVHIDAIGTTSAGSLVGLLAARCLLAGLDARYVLWQAWVENASLDLLLTGSGDAPLSMDAMEHRLHGLLDPRDNAGKPTHRAPDSARQRTPLVLHVSLGVLQALAYRIPGVLEEDPELSAMTHVDSADFLLRPGDGPERYTSPRNASPVDAVLASMAHPAVFAPRLLDRREDEDAYRRRGIRNFPDSGCLWYTDGSALSSPLGGTLAAARRMRADLSPSSAEASFRDDVHVLIHPHTGGPDSDGTWTDPRSRPRWSQGLSRFGATLTPEPVYTDLRRIEEANTRLRGAKELVDVLAPHLPAESAQELSSLLDRLETRPHAASEERRGDVAQLLRQAVEAVAGVEDKQECFTEVISPMRVLAGEDHSCADGARAQAQIAHLLAGDFLGRFGGLATRDLRRSDFSLGWRSCRSWMADSLPRYVGSETAQAAVKALDDCAPHDDPPRRGGASLSDLPLRSRAKVARVLLRGARVAVVDAFRT